MKLKGKVVITGIIQLLSPALIGCGKSENTDLDVLRDGHGFPFIPATSFLGVLRSILKEYKNIEDFEEYWGDHKHSSNIKCSDLYIKKDEDGNSGNNGNYSYFESRDGIKIDNKTGITEDKAKYDFEIIKSGTRFFLNKMEFDINEKLCSEKILNATVSILSKEFNIGAKTAVGFGRARLCYYSIYEFNFNNKKDILAWLRQDFSQKNKKEIKLIDNIDNNSYFILSFDLKRSLIIRSYSDNPEDPDSTHIKSNGKNVITGTSIKGALRARAERILNTLYDNEDEVNSTILSLFGGIDGNRNNKSVNIQIPSRLLVNEVAIDNVSEEIQHRIKIDRFSGGTIESALFDSSPVFAKRGGYHIKDFKISIKDANDSDIGLIMLIIKDLWTADLPIGGEKGVGRGVLEGFHAAVKHKDFALIISSIDDIDEKNKKTLNDYVNCLVGKKNMNYYKERYNHFAKKKNP